MGLYLWAFLVVFVFIAIYYEFAKLLNPFADVCIWIVISVRHCLTFLHVGNMSFREE